jgi:hypothetical protein
MPGLWRNQRDCPGESNGRGTSRKRHVDDDDEYLPPHHFRALLKKSEVGGPGPGTRSSKRRVLTGERVVGSLGNGEEEGHSPLKPCAACDEVSRQEMREAAGTNGSQQGEHGRSTFDFSNYLLIGMRPFFTLTNL